MDGFRFLDSSQESNNVGGFAIDGAGTAFVPVHSNGGKNLLIWKVLKTGECKLLENIPETKYGKFGGCSLQIDGTNVVVMMSVRGEGGKQRFATGVYPNAAIPHPTASGVLSQADRNAINRLKSFLGIL